MIQIKQNDSGLRKTLSQLWLMFFVLFFLVNSNSAIACGGDMPSDGIKEENAMLKVVTKTREFLRANVSNSDELLTFAMIVLDRGENWKVFFISPDDHWVGESPVIYFDKYSLEITDIYIEQ